MMKTYVKSGIGNELMEIENTTLCHIRNENDENLREKRDRKRVYGDWK